MTQRSLVAVIVVVAAGWAASVSGEEIYRWQDRSGLHFSNVPTTTGDPTGLRSDVNAAADVAPGAETPSQVSEGAPSVGAGEQVARPADYQRQLRDAQRRLRETDDELNALARARTSHAQGSVATGGVGTSADGFESDEEKALRQTRKLQEKDLQALRDGDGR